MIDKRDDMPVMVLLDKDGYLIRAGDPAEIDWTDIVGCARRGGTIKTVLFKEYAANDYNWSFEKQKVNS